MSSLNPYNRFELLELLRPPAGYDFDEAIGTTYSLDLLALLVLPVGFSDIELGVAEHEVAAKEPLKLLEAVRRVADRITVLCQAGQLRSDKHRQLFALLEPCVVQAAALEPNGSLHAKTWAVRYTNSEGDAQYRFLCLSRNLTFDSSWDTVAVLEGKYRSDRVKAFRQSRPLRAFYEGLMETPVQELGERHRARLQRFARELALVDFQPPDSFKEVAFFPMGFGTASKNPLDAKKGKLRIISPFLDRTFIADYVGKGDGLISRPESFDEIGADHLKGIDCWILNTPPVLEASEENDNSDDGTVQHAPIVRPTHSDLHAKVFVVERGRTSTLLTGSANATNRGFTRNIEFLVGFTGSESQVGIDAVFEEGDSTLSSLLIPYTPAPRNPEDANRKRSERALDLWCQRLASLPWQMEFLPNSSETRHRVVVSAPCGPKFAAPEGMTALVSLSGGSQECAVPLATAVDGAEFVLSKELDLTAFLQFEAESTASLPPIQRRFLVPARLIGAPTDRGSRLLGALIEQHGGLVNWLFLLLGATPVEGFADDRPEHSIVPGNGPSARRPDPTGLFEYLARAAVDSPERLATARLALDSLGPEHQNDASAAAIRALISTLAGGHHDLTT